MFPLPSQVLDTTGERPVLWVGSLGLSPRVLGNEFLFDVLIELIQIGSKGSA